MKFKAGDRVVAKKYKGRALSEGTIVSVSKKEPPVHYSVYFEREEFLGS